MDEPIEELFLRVAAEKSKFSREDIEKTRSTLFDTLQISSHGAMLLLENGPLLGQMRQELSVGLVFEVLYELVRYFLAKHPRNGIISIYFLKKLDTVSASFDERPRKRAKHGPHKDNATTKEELADKVIAKFPYPNLLDETLPKRKEDFIVHDLKNIHCTICDTTIKLNHQGMLYLN